MVEEDIVSYRHFSPEEIYDLAMQKLNVKAKLNLIPYNKNQQICDVSLNVRGFDDDKVFAKNPELLYNIRRGLSLIISTTKSKVYDSDTDSTSLIESRNISWARKGMFKFFDMYLSFVQHSENSNINQTGSFTQSFLSYTSKEKLRFFIFKELEHTILHQNGSVIIYQTIKANGENAQVSFYAPLNSWIVASKNVSLAAVSREDVNTYSEDRYTFAKMIAMTWFDILSKMPKERQESLKSDLSGYTIVGEFVGDPDHQHLVKYSQTTILFYALVKNDSQINTQPPLQAFHLFRKYGLECVNAKVIGEFDNLSNMYSTLEELYMKVASESLQEGEEGSVLYFVKNFGMRTDNIDRAERRLMKNEECDYDSAELLEEIKNQQTVSLCKLKTLEYRILRKLREKLKNIGKQNITQLFESFMQEVLLLKANHDLPQPLEYYKTLAKEAFEKVSHYSNVAGVLQSHYITFLENLMNGASLDSIFIDKEVYTPASAMNVVLCAPPLIYSESEIKNLCYDLGLYTVEQKWNESKHKGDKSERDLKKLYYLVDIPNISESFQKDAILVFVGFSEKWMDETVDKAKCMDEQTSTETLTKKTKNSYSSLYNLKRLEKTNAKYQIVLPYLQQHFGEYLIISEEKLDNPTLKDRILAQLQIISGPAEPQTQPKPEEEEEKVQVSVLISHPEEYKPVLKGRKVTYVIVPMGIPGMGKSNLIKPFKEIVEGLGCTMDVVSSDVVRKECIEEYIAIHPHCSFDVAFEKTRNSSKSKFESEIRNALQNGSNHHILFIDKNHPPNAIKGTLQLLKKQCPHNRILKIAALIPECKENVIIHSHNQVAEYPFSYEFLTQCLLRVKDRVIHETLQGSLEKKLEVILMMFKMYCNISFDNYLEEGFHSLIRVPFTYEGNIGITDELKDLINTAILHTRFGKGNTNDAAVNLAEYITHAEFRIKSFDPSPKLIAALYNFFGISHPSINIQPEEPYKKRESVSEEEKITNKQAKKQHNKLSRKTPIYIGIALESALGPQLMDLIFRYMGRISELFPENSNQILPDLEEISVHRYDPYVASAKVSESWSFTNSLHLTTLFLGNNAKQFSNPIYQQFSKGNQVMLKLKHFIYVPRIIIVASAEVLSTEVESDNSVPHVTLLKGSLGAKISNEVLNSIQSFTSFFKTDIILKGQKTIAFGIELSDDLILTGEYKDFY